MRNHSGKSSELNFHFHFAPPTISKQYARKFISQSRTRNPEWTLSNPDTRKMRVLRGAPGNAETLQLFVTRLTKILSYHAKSKRIVSNFIQEVKRQLSLMFNEIPQMTSTRQVKTHLVDEYPIKLCDVRRLTNNQTIDSRVDK